MCDAFGFWKVISAHSRESTSCYSMRCSRRTVFIPPCTGNRDVDSLLDYEERIAKWTCSRNVLLAFWILLRLSTPSIFSLPTCKVLGHPLIRRRLQQYRLLWGGATVARVNLWLVWLVRLLMMQHCDTMWIPLSLDPIGLFNKRTAFH